MSKRKLQEKKKKEREDRVKAKLSARRTSLRKEQRDAKKDFRLAKRFRERLQPIINDTATEQERIEAKDRAIKEKLQRNAEILKALEAEFLKEQSDRQALNQELEAKGHDTLEKKMEALNENAQKVKKKGRPGFKFKGESEVVYKPKS